MKQNVKKSLPSTNLNYSSQCLNVLKASTSERNTY